MCAHQYTILIHMKKSLLSFYNRSIDLIFSFAAEFTSHVTAQESIIFTCYKVHCNDVNLRRLIDWYKCVGAQRRADKQFFLSKNTEL